MTRGAVAHVGWRLHDPGPSPHSSLLDQVPWSSDSVEYLRRHQAWRRAVEADEARLARAHEHAKIWYPVTLQSSSWVVPLYGGSARTRIAAVATLVESYAAAGIARVRLVDLENSGALAQFESAPLRWAGVAGLLSCRGSDMDVFQAVTLDDLAGLVIDVLHAGSDTAALREAGRVKQRLLDVAKRIDEPRSLNRLQDAVRCALTGQPPVGSAFTTAEQSSLLDYHNVDVTKRRDLADSLDKLADDLATLAQYAAASSAHPRAFGSGRQILALLAADASTGLQDYLLGRELLARYVARQAQQGALGGAQRGGSALMILGADHLSVDVLRGLTAAAERHGVHLLLFFDRLAEGPGAQLLGVGGSPRAVVFALSHPADTQRAAEFLGRDYKFVVNGQTITEGTSAEWSTASSLGIDQSTTRSWNFGQGFGSSVSRGMSRSQQQTSTSGGGTSSSTATSTGRVHEFVVEPEEFTRLPDGAALVIQGDEVVLTFCDPAIRRRPATAALP